MPVRKKHPRVYTQDPLTIDFLDECILILSNCRLYRKPKGSARKGIQSRAYGARVAHGHSYLVLAAHGFSTVGCIPLSMGGHW